MPTGTLPPAGKCQFEKVYKAALAEYGDEGTAARVAWASVKKKYVKVGDRWVRRTSKNSKRRPMVIGKRVV